MMDWENWNCNFCHFYDSLNGICWHSKENKRGDDGACERFRYYMSALKKEPDDYVSFFLDCYLVEVGLVDDAWFCFMSDTTDGAFMQMFLSVHFDVTKEEAVKLFLQYIQNKASEIRKLAGEEVYEISKNEYLSLMDKNKEVE